MTIQYGNQIFRQLDVGDLCHRTRERLHPARLAEMFRSRIADSRVDERQRLELIKRRAANESVIPVRTTQAGDARQDCRH